MMRVLFVTHFYPPEELSMSFLIQEIAEAMAARQHDVYVLTGYPNWPSGKYFKGGRPYWGLPDLELSEFAYKQAKKAFEKDGRNIYDATVNGKLDISPKISVDEAKKYCGITS